MKAFNTIMKIVTALAAVAGAVYVAATYGDQIVAWCKKVLASLPKCPCCEQCAPEEFVDEEPIPEAPAQEEAPAEEPEEEDEVVEEIPMAPLAENEPVAEEHDFAE